MSILTKLGILIAIERSVEVSFPDESQRHAIREQIRDIIMMFKFEPYDALTRHMIENEIYDHFGPHLNVCWTVSEHGRPQVYFTGEILPNTIIFCTL